NGDVYFTDPGHYPPSDEDAGRVLIYGRDGQVRTFASGFSYCNGIAFDRDGAVVVVERRGLLRVHDDGEREWVIETLGRGGGDGSRSTSPAGAPRDHAPTQPGLPTASRAPADRSTRR